MKILEWLLSRMFPPKLDLKLNRDDLNQTLEYRRRLKFVNGNIHVWSGWTGNKREHPAEKKLTIQERRRREIPSTHYLRAECFDYTYGTLPAARTRPEEKATDSNGGPCVDFNRIRESDVRS